MTGASGSTPFWITADDNGTLPGRASAVGLPSENIRKQFAFYLEAEESAAVPEPGSMAFLVSGGAVLLLGWRFRRQ